MVAGENGIDYMGVLGAGENRNECNGGERGDIVDGVDLRRDSWDQGAFEV